MSPVDESVVLSLHHILQKSGSLIIFGRLDSINFIYLNIRFLTKVFDGHFPRLIVVKDTGLCTQTQGKIERYYRTMKNVIKLDNYYFPEDLMKAIEEFVNNYNYKRYHESLNNLTPADVYFGRDKKILKERIKIKEKTLKKRRKDYIKRKLESEY